jgi:GNAT superfamily N-acetyltransferase
MNATTAWIPYRIRQLGQDDSIDELTAMIHRAFARFGRQGLRCTGVEQTLAITTARIRRGECWIALAPRRLAGTFTLEMVNHRSECGWYRKPDVASLHQFAVDPVEQGRGCGDSLLDTAERRALALGCRELALETPSDATGLIRYYEVHGFRAVGELHKADKTYCSTVLSKRLARQHGNSTINLWASPHRRALWW